VEQFYGIPQENTVAIGDSDPDMDMVRYAGIGIAMGNSTPGLKAWADLITKPIAEHGAAYAMALVLGKEKADME